jgi:hypothetical protein
MHANLRLFDVSTDERRVERILLGKRNYDILTQEIVMNDDVPSTNRRHGIEIVYLSVIRDGEYLFDETELILETIHEYDVM